MPHHEEGAKRSYGPGPEEIYLPIEIEHLQMGGQCFVCKEEGHYAQYCLKKDTRKGGSAWGRRMEPLEVWCERLNPLEIQRLRDEGRCFYCKQMGHTSRRCPKKQGGKRPPCSDDSSKGMDDEDSNMGVGESNQTWKPNGHGNVHVTRQGEDGQQAWAKYIRFETVRGEPMVYGIMDDDEAIYEEPLRAAPCYDTFPFPTPIEGSYHAFLNVHDFDRTAIKEVEALEDHGILAELYQYKRYELEETSIHHEEVQE